jgi:hypothetical protein
VLSAGTGQDDPETINSEVQLVFRKKTRGQVIGAELQEGFAHIGVAATEAGRLAAEQLGPRVAAAREAAGPTLDAASKAAQKAVAPKVAAAVAVAAPAVASARESIAPRMEAAREALAPRVEAARDALGPRVEAARDAAGPRLAAAQAAAAKAAADLAPRVEAAQKTLINDVVPRLEEAQKAAVAYAAPRVAAARVAVVPALESARETLAAGVDSALSELDARRAELVATAEKSGRKARKTAKKARKTAVRKRHDFEKAAAATAKTVKRGAVQKKSRRWPWALAVLGIVAGVVVLLRGKKQDSWTPAPAGDGPVPSYREDPVPSAPSTTGTVSDAEFAAGDSTPDDSDLGMQTSQMAEGDETDSVRDDVRGPGVDGDKA